MSEVHTPLEVAEGVLSGKYSHTSVFMLVNLIEDLIRERDEARAQIKRLQSDNDHLQQARNDALTGGDVLKAEVERLTQRRDDLRAAIDRTYRLMKDPDVVAVNMLRGTIAKPTVAQIRHIYGEELDKEDGR